MNTTAERRKGYRRMLVRDWVKRHITELAWLCLTVTVTAMVLIRESGGLHSLVS
ncbi:hypothetical protein LJ739_06860 [Aestuariibacter halophilus]|uniref:Uncharacterized protein n=1 Tax=Fluctibacter halophilus TaxID=226011 RepID=A0ABS8G5V7_9ALTE|nr:hypothetical protein [Aestuariibacter halophilus]MCC2615957.1 hypothetical protein [Aestuariibacter halophilus]